ncbi:MAG: response regulator [Candidatus Omnitrophica bacterium]|nr:response regulator [Candidatus Omnitrophota bacterium]
MAKILVIEDNVQMMNVLKDLLERNNYTVITAENGAQGVHLYRKDPPDLIITDMVMPIKGGTQAILDIKQHDPSAKIIAISGGGLGTAEEYLEVARVLNARYTFKKPFSNEELLTAIKVLIG